jgi:hypothetical protein
VNFAEQWVSQKIKLTVFYTGVTRMKPLAEWYLKISARTDSMSTSIRQAIRQLAYGDESFIEQEFEWIESQIVKLEKEEQIEKNYITGKQLIHWLSVRTIVREIYCSWIEHMPRKEKKHGSSKSTK